MMPFLRYKDGEGNILDAHAKNEGGQGWSSMDKLKIELKYQSN